MRVFFTIFVSLFISFSSTEAQTIESLIDSADLYLNKQDEKAHNFLENAVDLAFKDSLTIPMEQLPYVQLMIRHISDITRFTPQYWNRAANYLKKYDNHAATTFCYLKETDFYRISDQLDEALVALDSGFVYANKLDYGFYVGVAYSMQGAILIAQADYFRAKQSFKENLKRTKTDPPNNAYIRAIIELSTLYAIPEQIDSAFFYLNEARRMADQIEYRKYRARSRADMAMIYSKVGNCDSAIHYIDLARSFRLDGGDTLEINSSYCASAKVYMDCYKFGRAKIFIDSAIYLADTKLVDLNLINPLALNATYLVKTGNLQEGLELYEEVLTKLQQSTRKSDLIDESITVLEEIRKTNPEAISNGLAQLFQKELSVLAMLPKEEFQPEQAISFALSNAWNQSKTGKAITAYETVDSLYLDLVENYNKELKNKRLQIEGLYELALRRQQLVDEKLVSQELKAAAEIKNYWLLFGLAVLILLLVILLFAVRNFKQKKEKLVLLQKVNEQRIALAEKEIGGLGKELAKNKKELTAFTLEVIDKNNLLREMSANLKKARTEQDFTNVERELNLGLKEKKDWTEFRERFEKTDPEFIKKLRINYPDLTEGQVRLASLIKLGFSSKQIAEFLNNTPASVDVARSKLRKKMALEKDVDFAEFLKNR